MNLDDKVNIITRNLQEVVGKEQLVDILKKRPSHIYWGTAPTGAPHLGYFVPMIKVGDFLKAGQDVTILFADLHASLDNLKSTFEQVKKRTEFYEIIIKTMLTSIGAPLDKLKFVRGKQFQLDNTYTMKMYELASITTLTQAKHAGADVVKKVKDPVLSGMLYPLLQALDEVFLQADVQFGGVDQRKIFMFARDQLPKLGYKKRIHLMNPLIPGLTKTGKMSSSEPNSKVDFFDSEDVITKKIVEAFSVDGKVEGNCLMMVLKYIIFPTLSYDFVVVRDEKYGGTVVYKDFDGVKKDFVERRLCSADLKPAVAREIIKIVTPIRKVLLENKVLFEEAYKPLEELINRKPREEVKEQKKVQKMVQKKVQKKKPKKKKEIPPEEQIKKNEEAMQRMLQRINELKNKNVELSKLI